MKKGRQYIDGLAALLLFGIFAVCVVEVLLTGAGAYRRLTARDEAVCDRRTRTQYIATRVRQADGRDQVSVSELEGLTALRLLEDDGYVTWIYCWDGWLMELYTSAEAELGPEDGTQLMEASALSLSLEDGLLEIGVTGPAGDEDRLYLALRSGEGYQA